MKGPKPGAMTRRRSNHLCVFCITKKPEQKIYTMKRSSLFMLLILFTLACQEDDNALNRDAQFDQNEDGWSLPDGDLAEMEPQGDPYDLNAVRLEAEVLTIETSYVGGCKEHLFELRWPDQLTAESEAVPVLLVHDNQNDLCEAANITQTFTTDLSAVALLSGLDTYKLIIVNASNPAERVTVPGE